MGFVKGKAVTVIKNAPLKDPIEYSIMDYSVSLRRREAEMVEVLPESEASAAAKDSYTAATTIGLHGFAKSPDKIIDVALVGNPNTGKTSLFNQLTRAHEHVGNYSGVTVEQKTAHIESNGYTINITDLPGTYSLTAYSPEELYVRSYIAERLPDVVINVVDATNLERNLYLTTQLIDMDVKVVMALNMYDELEKHGDKLNYVALGKMLGIPMVPTVGSRGRGLDALMLTAICAHLGEIPDSVPNMMLPQHIHINYREEVEQAISQVQQFIRIPENEPITDLYSSRFLAIKLLEKDSKIQQKLKERSFNPGEILLAAEQQVKKLEANFSEDSATVISDAKYGFIAGAVRETMRQGKKERHHASKQIDTILTNKILGFPVFLIFMWLMFYITFTLGSYPVEWINSGVSALSLWLSDIMPENIFKSLLVDGVVNGVGSVIAFLPNILLLFLFISIFEDTGYMARAVFITDKLMHAIGLHGKSFIPLIMGFGCNVPALMATRTIENRNQRLLTMLMLPFMSCSARLPVYILLIGAFFPHHPGTILFGIYLAGILFSILSAFIASKSTLKDNGQPFVMELPPYRIPTLRSILRHMWYKGSQYLKKMGGIILIAALAIWALNTFPLNQELKQKYSRLEADTIAKYDAQLTAGATAETNFIGEQKDIALHKLHAEAYAAQAEQSYLGRIGKIVEPAMRPLGFDWKMSVSLLTGIIAKETVVSTMGVIYQSDDIENSTDLQKKLRNDKYTTGPKTAQPVFTAPVALAFLVFILLYFPCVAVVGTIYRESQSRLFTLFMVLYTTGAAWVAAFLIYQIGNLL
jgi:ferrous iron transport protein B